MAEVIEEVPLVDISDDALAELINRRQEAVEKNVSRLFTLADYLSLQGKKYRRYSYYIRIIIIVFGALVATRVIADTICASFFTNSSECEVQHYIEIPYALLALIIAVTGGLDAAFKPGDIATEATFLSVSCGTTIREVEQGWARNVERFGASTAALVNIDPIIDKLYKHIDDIEKRLAQLHITPPLQDENIPLNDTS